MRFLEARRLPGPNVLWDKPGAVLDIACSPGEADRLIPYCESAMRQMLGAIGWGAEAIRHRRLAGGVSIAFSAPIDALYSAAAVCEWVWASCDAHFNGAVPPDFDDSVAEIRQAIADESNPTLLVLAQAAADRGVSLLWDDDDVSIGHGSRAQTWPFRELPEPDSLDWSRYGDIPVGIVTGTNGKTTTARIAKHLIQAAGLTVGLSCTDWVAVNDEIIDRDDWSGPGGARLVLRQPGVEAAILETARGGLLRRGLGVDRADAALITNVAEDHLGDFGSQNLAELLEIKWVVTHAVRHRGCLILNAEDALLVGKAADFPGRLVWFALDAGNIVVSRHVADDGVAFVLAGDELVRLQGGRRATICAVGEIPITLAGAARHNVANALGAAALCAELGLSLQQVREGLATMSQDANPGRSNLFDIDGFRVLVDFAHNPEAMQALFAMASALPAKRRVLCFGQAGDRTDKQIRELARSAWSMGIELAFVSELEHYRRGRMAGEVFAIIRDELLKCGARDDQIRYFEEEAAAFDAALDWARDGDLVVILDLGRASDLQRKLKARSSAS